MIHANSMNLKGYSYFHLEMFSFFISLLIFVDSTLNNLFLSKTRCFEDLQLLHSCEIEHRKNLESIFISSLMIITVSNFY